MEGTSAAPAAPKRCEVVFAVDGAVLGNNESLGIGGNVESLGKGTPIPMIQSDESPSVWHAQVDIPCGIVVEYRYAIMNDFNTKLVWEQDTVCRTLEIPGGVTRLELEDHWGTAVDRALHVGMARRAPRAAGDGSPAGSAPGSPSMARASLAAGRVVTPLVAGSPAGAFAQASPTPGGDRGAAPAIGARTNHMRPPSTMGSPPSQRASMIAHAPTVSCSGDTDVLFTGYLTKQGERMKNWKRRFFILTTATLLYYVDSSKIAPKGKIPVSEITGIKLTTIVGKEDKFAFELLTKRRTFILFADQESHRARWTDEFRKLRLQILSQ